MATSAYVHIPFCSHKCDFCDFTAFAGLDHLAEEYSNVVAKEVRERLQIEGYDKPLKSLFYGGGTPGLIDPSQLKLMHDAIAETVGIAPDAEVSLETTPTTITEEKVRQWVDIGINRISIGVQSFQDSELDAMGRGHSRQAAIDGIQAAQSCGLPNISCDLMYGLPLQTVDSWRDTVKFALSFDLPHMSAYGLTIAGNSPLLLRFPRDSKDYPDEDKFVAMYETLVELAEAAGLQQYEISNFAKPGFQSTHNLSYWSNEEYYAFGVGAHRYVNGTRSSNWRSMNRYMADYLGAETQEEITENMRVQEAVFLGLRTRAGIDLSSFKRQYGLDLLTQKAESIGRLTDGGFIELTGGRLFLSQKGVLVSNLVMSELI
jgi:putative oxygen-independent coproporphyrinogen III oxidase